MRLMANWTRLSSQTMQHRGGQDQVSDNYGYQLLHPVLKSRNCWHGLHILSVASRIRTRFPRLVYPTRWESRSRRRGRDTTWQQRIFWVYPMNLDNDSLDNHFLCSIDSLPPPKSELDRILRNHAVPWIQESPGVASRYDCRPVSSSDGDLGMWCYGSRSCKGNPQIHDGE